MGAERPWEQSYPPGVRWDAAIETATLPALFDAFTKKWAAKPALEYRDRKTSFAELRSGVEAVASGLMELDVGLGTSVALYLPNTPYHPLSFFGILVSIGSVLLYFVIMTKRIVEGAPLDTLRTFWDRDILQFFLTGIVLFGLGLVSEYVGRIYQQVRNRPRYLVQAVLEKNTSDSWQQERSSSATAT